ncbi:unnamed protein product [Leptidea sinapis]|uniref:C2H2-type domain-containing protein n=1 Tax=Leptidea sinapis TaxID=189913 RepID=A0A5E4PZS6_9NEOP|nr:unnamed protein product [Leptidea sinapis]
MRVTNNNKLTLFSIPTDEPLPKEEDIKLNNYEHLKDNPKSNHKDKNSDDQESKKNSEEVNESKCTDSKNNVIEDKEFKCTVCSKKFPTRKKLYLHRRFHNKTICCQYKGCDRKFTNKSDLDKHNRIHTGEKPFKCEICERAFRQRGTLKSHKIIIHNLFDDKNSSVERKRSDPRSVEDTTGNSEDSKMHECQPSENTTLPDVIPINRINEPNKRDDLNTSNDNGEDSKCAEKVTTPEGSIITNSEKPLNTPMRSRLLFESTDSDSVESLVIQVHETVSELNFDGSLRNSINGLDLCIGEETVEGHYESESENEGKLFIDEDYHLPYS